MATGVVYYFSADVDDWTAQRATTNLFPKSEVSSGTGNGGGQNPKKVLVVSATQNRFDYSTVIPNPSDSYRKCPSHALVK